MIWRGVGFGGTCLDCEREILQVSGYLVALQACWISGWLSVIDGDEEGD